MSPEEPVLKALGINNVTGSGGVLLAGTSTVFNIDNPPPPSFIVGGGINPSVLVNGSATNTINTAYTGSSGGLLNGSNQAIMLLNPVPTEAGGVLTDGTWGNTVLFRPLIVASGVSLSGQITNQNDIENVVASGGTIISGQGNNNLGKIISTTTSGGVSTSGQTVHYPTALGSASGGMQLAGAVAYGINVYLYGKHDLPANDYRINVSGEADIVKSVYTHIATGGLKVTSSTFDPSSQMVTNVVTTSFHANDVTCNDQIAVTCVDIFPNVHNECFSVKFFTPEQRNHIPKSQTKSGAFLPAITACRQGLYLPLP